MQVCARDLHIKEVGTGIGVIDVHELLYDKGVHTNLFIWCRDNLLCHCIFLVFGF